MTLQRRMIVLVAIGFLAVGPACALEFDAAIGKTGTGRCHMDGCSFFAIQTATPVFTLKDGTLFAISELSWCHATS